VCSLFEHISECGIMKTFKQFQEAVPLIPVVGGVAAKKLLLPIGMTAVGALGTYLQSKGGGPFSGTGGFDASKSRTKRQYLGLPPSTGLTKQEKKDRKIKGQQEIINRRDDQIAREGPGDLVPDAKRARLKRLLDRYSKNKN
tara:strand:- start:131 stop:556 length:426 start_codon:yes stop_codon:yes gene_type:complete